MEEVSAEFMVNTLEKIAGGEAHATGSAANYSLVGALLLFLNIRSLSITVTYFVMQLVKRTLRIRNQKGKFTVLQRLLMSSAYLALW